MLVGQEAILKIVGHDFKIMNRKKGCMFQINEIIIQSERIHDPKMQAHDVMNTTEGFKLTDLQFYQEMQHRINPKKCRHSCISRIKLTKTDKAGT